MIEALRRNLARLVFAASIVVLVVLVVLTTSRLNRRPRTDDAFLSADIVHVAPQVSGQIAELDVENNQLVHTGDILFVIDQQPFRLRVEQALANVASLEATLAITTTQVASQVSSAQAADVNVASAVARSVLANDTLRRLTPLGAKGYVSKEQVEEARTNARTASIGVQEARAESAKATEAISSTAPVAADLEGARATLALAERDLRLTTVRAPCDGRITALDITRGEYAAVGSPVFTIIDTDRWYAVGDFRETDLARLAVGQQAVVFVLASPGQPVSGHVESMGWGVTPDEDSDVGGLPRVPRSLDWVRIAQRFPVRVLLDAPPPALMRLGATVSIVIDR